MLRTFGISVRRVIAAACTTGAAIALVCTASPGRAAAAPHAAIVVDANTGAVLHDRSADEPRYPASLTKMMTLYLLFERLDQRRVSLASRIPVSEEAASQPPSKLGIKAGGEISVEDAIRALVTKSANDVAVAVAEFLAGSEAKFAADMTAKARALGMRGTRFKNPHGLPDSDQVTTARDMITLALALADHFPRQWRYFSTQTFRWSGNVHRNHNTLLFGFEGVDGIKTGYTRASGFNLVSSVRRGEKHLVAAVFGGSSAATRNAEMRYLLTRGLLKASTRKTRFSSPALIASKPRPPAEAEGAVPRPRLAAAPAERRSPGVDVVREQARAQSRQPQAADDVGPDARPLVAPAPVLVGTVSARTPTIEIARVRTVAIEPSPRRQPPIVREPSIPTAAAAPESRELPARPPRAEPMAHALARLSPGPGNRVDAEPLAPANFVKDPADRPGAAPGRPPSTLQAQADALQRSGWAGQQLANARWSAPETSAQSNLAAGRSSLRGPEARTGQTGSGSGLFIQVGAFASQGEAERRLAQVRERGGSVLQGRTSHTLAGVNGGRTYYRARFGGFEVQTATQACTELRRQQIDCFVARAE